MSASPADPATRPVAPPARPGRRRRLRRAAVLAVGTVLAAAAIAHVPPVQRWLLRQAAAQLEARTGLLLRWDRAGFDPASLTITLDNASLASRTDPGSEYVRADHIEIDATRAILRGRPVFERITLRGVVVDQRLVPESDGPGEPFRGLGALQAGRVSIERLTYIVGTPESGRLTIAGVSLTGSGEDPGVLRLTTAVPGTLLFELDEARIPLDDLRASLALDGDRLTIESLSGASDTGTARVSGSARFDRGYALDLAYDASIDLARAPSWWGLTASTRGRARLTGRIAGPLGAPTATIDARADGFAWSTLTPGRLTATGAVGGEGIRVDTFRLAVAELAAGGYGFLSWGASPPSTVVADWHSPLLRRLGPLVELDPATIPLVAADGRAELRWPAFVPDLAGLSGTIDARLRSRAADGSDDGRVRMAGGRTRWRVDWQQRLPGETVAEGSFGVRVDPGVFARSTMDGTLRVDVGNMAPAIRRAAELDISVPETALERLEAGRAALEGPVRGTVAMPQWLATFTARDVVMAGLGGIRARGTFTVDPDWFRTDALLVEAPGSRVNVRGTIGVLEANSDVTFDGIVDAAWASAPFAPAAWPLTGTAAVEGTWTTREDVDDLDVRFSSSDAALAGSPLGPIDGRGLSGLTAASGEMALPELGVRVSGRYDEVHPESSHARGTFTRSAVGRWLALAGISPDMRDGIDVTVDGTFEASGTLASPDTTAVRVRLSDVRGNVRGRPVTLAAPTDVTWENGALAWGDTRLTAGSATMTAGRAEGQPDALAVTLVTPVAELLAMAPPGSMPQVSAEGDVRVDAVVPARDPARPAVTLAADLRSVTRDGVRAIDNVRAEVRATRDRIDLTRLTGAVMGAVVDMAGGATTAWLAPALGGGPATRAADTAHLAGTVDADAARVLAAFGVASSELAGQVRATLALTAARPELAALDGRIVADTLTVQTPTGTFAADGPVRVRLAGGRAVIEAFSLAGPDSRLGVAGHVDLTRGPVDVRVAGTASMALLDAVVAPRVGGSADVVLHVGGRVDAPVLDGSLRLKDVSVLSNSPRVVLAALNGTVTVGPDSIESVDLRGQLNGGDFSVAGSLPVEASSSEGAIRLTASDVFLEYPAGLKNRIAADLTLSGSVETPNLGGAVTFLSDAYRESLPKFAQLLSATGQPPAAVGGGAAVSVAGARPDLLDRLSLNVAVSAGAPMRLDNSLGRIEAVPRLRLLGTAANPLLSGPVEILDGGRIHLQSRTYTLADSRLDFFPEDGMVPRIQLAGSTRVAEYDVTLRISGPVDAFDVTITSDPPLPERDLLGLLVTGQTGDGQQTDNASFALTALSSDLLGVAGQALGLDSVRIGAESFELVSSDVTPTTRLTLTKTLLDRFELVYSDSLEDNTATWIVIYRPGAAIELRALSRDNLVRTGEFRHRVSFGPGGTRRAQGRGAGGAIAPPAVRETIAAVTITGEDPATAARLRTLLRQKVGRAFDFAEWMRDHDRIRRYFVDAGFLTVQVVPTRSAGPQAGRGAVPVSLGYRIARGPATSVVITGLRAEPSLLEAVRQAWTTTTFDQFAAEDLTRAARAWLLDRGYVKPVVNTSIDDSSPGTLAATVAVEAGPRPSSRVVAFDGMEAFLEADLVAIAYASGTAERAWRDPESLCHAVVAAYAAAGYRAATATPAEVRFVRGTAELPIVIDEGRPTRLARAVFEGIPDAQLTAAEAAAGLSTDMLLPAGEERAARLRLERHFRNLGYRNATVSAALGAPGADGRADVRLTVELGRLQIVRRLTVEGAATTRRSLIDRAVLLEVGEPARQSAITETERRLYRLGVFSAADVRLTPAVRTPADASPDVVPMHALVSVTEPRRFQLVYGVEFSNEYGPVFDHVTNAVGLAADLRDRNVFGRGWSASAGGRYEQHLRAGRAQVGVPAIGGWPVRTNVFASVRDEQTYASDEGSINEIVSSAAVEQRWRPRSWLDLSWGYTIAARDLTFRLTRGGSDVQSLGVLASVNGTVVIDRRDNVMNTRRGWFHSSSWQQGLRAIGSDFAYTRFLGRAFGFLPLGRRVVAATGVRVGTIWNTSGEASIDTLDLLFKAGGAQTVRGYGQDALSAVEVDGLPLGGTRLLVLNQELRATISRWLQAAVFVDAGNTFADRIALSDLAVGVGAGLRIITPLAPLRIDLAFPVPRRDGDRKYRLHFSVGHIF